MKYVKPQITITFRKKDGKPSIRVIRCTPRRREYVFKGEVTFVSVTCQVEGGKGSSKKKQKVRGSSLRRILRRGLKSLLGS